MVIILDSLPTLMISLNGFQVWHMGSVKITLILLVQYPPSLPPSTHEDHSVQGSGAVGSGQKDTFRNLGNTDLPQQTRDAGVGVGDE